MRPVADTADTESEADLADSTQTAVEDQLSLALAAGTASSPEQAQRTFAEAVAVAVASTEAASAAPVLDDLAASS